MNLRQTWDDYGNETEGGDMSPVIDVTREELIARRARILGSLGLTLDEYLSRAEANELSGLEWDVRDDLDTIAFLLGEERFVD